MGCGASKTEVQAAANAGGGKKDNGKAASSSAIPGLSKANNDEDIRDKYELGKVLGSGSFGQVREAKLIGGGPDAEVRAVKMIEPDKGDGDWSNQAIFVREVSLLQQMNDDNIIRYYDFYEDIHFLYVVMELCKGGEVFAKIVELKRFGEKDAARIGEQMLKALDYIHKLNIAHRDVKAENFMLADESVQSNVKMIDFGMATKFKQDQVLTELCGSPHYLSPELIGQKYNHMADIWAFGVLLYLLMYGRYPYDAKHPRDIMVKILTEPITWETKAKLSKEAIDFVKKLLEHNVKKRLTAEQALNHSWCRKASIKVSASSDDSEVLPVEVVRSAHKKVTGLKKQILPEVEQLRNQKLDMISEDYKKGIRHGQRLGETPKEEYMKKPEFVRRENKIVSAPARDLNKRRNSLKKIISMVGGSKAPDANSIKEEDEDEEATAQGGEIVQAPPRQPPRLGRAMSLTDNPRRLSYLPGITKQDEGSFQLLFLEKKAKSNAALGNDTLTSVMPDGGATLPGTSPAKAE